MKATVLEPAKLKKHGAIPMSFDELEVLHFGPDAIEARDEDRRRNMEARERKFDAEEKDGSESDTDDEKPRFPSMRRHLDKFKGQDGSEDGSNRPPETYNRYLDADDGTYENHPDLKSFVSKTDASSRPYDKQVCCKIKIIK